jgi:hypothetical protein
MIIPKEQLSAEDVRVEVERFVGEHLNWEIDGYKCDSSTVIQVLRSAKQSHITTRRHERS